MSIAPPTRRVLGLAAVLALLAAPVTAALPGHPTSVLALLLLPSFVVADCLVVHFELGEQAHTATLSEIPLVVGFLCADLRWVVACRVLAGGLVFAARRQPWLKLSFNIAQFGCSAATAAGTYALLARLVPGGVLGSWAAASSGALVAATVSVLAVLAAIRVTQGPTGKAGWSLLQGSTVSAVTASTVGMLAALVVRQDPDAVVLLAVLGSASLPAYRNHVRQISRFAMLRSLYDFLRGIGPATAGPDVVHAVLEQSQRLLKADRASIVLWGDTSLLPTPDARAEGVVATLCSGEPLSVVPLLPPLAAHPLARELSDGVSRLVTRRTHDAGDLAWLRDLDARDAVLVPIPLSDQVSGALLVTNRRTDVRSFSDDDVEVLQGLANHAAVALLSGRLVDQLMHDSRHDPLTGLANRTVITESLQARARDAATSGAEHALLLLDLDRFKDVNDSLGHHAGDHLLTQISRRLAQHVRPGDTVARLAGDEFAVLLPDTDLTEARALADSLRLAVRAGVEVDGVWIEVQASVGIAAAPQHGEDAETLLRHADRAMYVAKAGAGVSVFDPADEDLSNRQLTLTHDLRQALAAGSTELFVAFQPLVGAVTGTPTGLEALIRWNHPSRGPIAPDVLVPLAERAKLMPSLTGRVLSDSLAALAQLDPALRVSVNLSARDLLTPDLVAQVATALTRNDIAPDRLTLEITESTLMGDRLRCLATLESLREVGVRLSIDDFGTGYSSLAYLKELPVQEVKIDRSFIAGIATTASDQAIVSAVVALAHSLRLDVVAEGIEDGASLQSVTRLGCDLMQGYHLARPMPLDLLKTWLAGQCAAPDLPVALPRQRSRVATLSGVA